MILGALNSHRTVSFLTDPKQWRAVNIFVCLDLKISRGVIHSRPLFVTNPENPFMTDESWSPYLLWMGPECHNGRLNRNIHNTEENATDIKTFHSPTPRLTDFQQWCKNSLTLGILNRDPPDELLSRLSHQMKWKLNNTVISNIGWWLWGPADILYLEEEVKSWDSCCVLGVTCTLVITVSRWYNIGAQMDGEM